MADIVAVFVIFFGGAAAVFYIMTWLCERKSPLFVGERKCRKAAQHLRNYAGTMLNMGGVTHVLIADILASANSLDGLQPDERFSDIQGRLATGGEIAKFNEQMNQLKRVNDLLRARVAELEAQVANGGDQKI